MKTRKVKLKQFDATRFLDSDEAIAEYLSSILEMNDTTLLLAALSDIARARGIAKVAKDAGLGRESLYKALNPAAKPRFETIMRVVQALGLHLKARPA